MTNLRRAGSKFIIFGSLFLSVCLQRGLLAQEPGATGSVKEQVLKAWAEEGHSDFKDLNQTIDKILKEYESRAQSQSLALKGFPSLDELKKYEVMNAVATAFFIHAESLMHQGKTQESIEAFKDLIKNYPYAQSWDPSRGAYWSIAEKSQSSINVMTGAEEKAQQIKIPRTKPVLFSQGTDKIIDYSKYGTFSGIGTKDYKFHMNNPNVLSKAIGEGIYPNTGDVFKNPQYSKVFKEGRLKGSHWDLVNTPDLQAAYLKWASAPEDPGVKLFYTGFIFEKAGLYLQAVKAYHALIVNFPATVSWTYWHTKWFPAQVAVSKIKFIIRMHPELNIRYEGGKIQFVNDKAGQMLVITNPGVVKSGKAQKKAVLQDLGSPVRTLGGDKTKLVQYGNGHWRMFVDGKPFIIKGITYMPTKVGESPDDGTLGNWMTEDTNNDGIPDSPYQSFIDKNDHNNQHPNEVVVGDFQLLKEMGVNALRLYHQPFKPVKSVLRDLYKRYGIGVLMGDYLGKYTFGSGAPWDKGTDYEDPLQQAKMLKSVEDMVQEHKDEPYVLLWVLGNENNYGVACNANTKPDAFYKFANKVAKRIKEIDPTRPVALVNGDVLYSDKFAADAPDIDILSANVYRGDYGFGDFWDDVKRTVNKPVYITEYGAPGYSNQEPEDQAETQQAFYDQGNWLDILENSAGYQDGEGNAIGGVAFEWIDEWYKNYAPWVHDTKADASGPFPGGYYFEEWFGITGQGDGKHSPFLRHLKKAYFTYKKLWNS